MGFTTAGNASLPPYTQVAWFSSASRYVRQEITRRIIELLSGQTHSENISMSQPDNSISVAKVQRKSETTKNKEKKTLDYLSISAPIAEARDNQEFISAAKLQQNFETAKDLAKKSCHR